MKYRDNIVIRVTAGLLAAYFCAFLAITQHPGIHFLAADLNYTDIQTYVTSGTGTGTHRESVPHFHRIISEEHAACMVCTYFTAHFKKNVPVVETEYRQYFEREHFDTGRFVTQSAHYSTPGRRAPPAA